ncbi:MAG TPA: hypothetical protein VGD29_08295 [Actinoplanes sp.]
MSIGFTWRRVAGVDIAGLTGEKPRPFAPHGPAPEYAPDGPWADHLLRCADELTRLFGAAAAARESVVFSMNA